jgi:hypothetical protein
VTQRQPVRRQLILLHQRFEGAHDRIVVRQIQHGVAELPRPLPGEIGLCRVDLDGLEQQHIGIEPEVSGDSYSEEENKFSSSTPEEKTIDLLGRLNMSEDLWQINEAASSSYGQLARRQLGLFTDPDYVIECNLNYSGTWLFVYSNENDAYDAFNSDYFFRNSNYSAELLYDPDTNLIVILHTSVGGKKQCIDSAFEQIAYYATD